MRTPHALILLAVFQSWQGYAVAGDDAPQAPVTPTPIVAPADAGSAATSNTPAATPVPAPSPAPAAPAPVASEPAIVPAPAVAPAPEATTSAAASPAPTQSTAAVAPSNPGILVLPAEFTVFQQSTATMEPVPEWTEDAKRNLTDSARRVLGTDGRFQVIELPQLPADQAAALREHIELFKIIGSQIEGVVKPGGSAWQDTRANADYRIGPGLAFLKQRTGARYAFVMAGAEIRHTGGNIFMQILLAGLTGVYSVGAGTYMYGGVIDLNTGRLVWFGSEVGPQAMGISSGPDARKAGGADAAVGRMLRGYPLTSGLNLGVVVGK